MLCSIGSERSRPPRWVVFAYDIRCPRRARLARAAIAPHTGPRQLSVCECRLSASWTNDLLAELAAIIGPEEDSLGWWWPRDGVCLAVEAGDRCAIRDPSGFQSVISALRCGNLLAGSGNFIISYDISSSKVLQGVHREVASGGAMVQRSVYQWRCGLRVIEQLFIRCGRLLQPGDRFSVHPLARAGDLQRLSERPCDLLPMANHHWRNTQ